MTAAKRFTFIGVTTAGSAIMRVFPEWVDYLGVHDLQIVGVDLPIHAERDRYRDVVQRLKTNPDDVGALVTTHKIDLLHACRDLFDYLDPYAQLCGEVSSLSKLDGRFEGHAKDPISAGKSLDLIVPEGYWGGNRGRVLCLGAGGSAIAITLCFMTQEKVVDRPSGIVVVNRSQPRLEEMAAIHRTIGADVAVDYICNDDPRANDELLRSLPDGSMVVNATGRGKDSPGSPITDDGVFPFNGIAWELNYRGELDFLQQARRQAERRNLSVHDGWDYFVFGWTAVIEQVLHIHLTDDRLGGMSRIAKALAPVTVSRSSQDFASGKPGS